jgi:putative transposase
VGRGNRTLIEQAMGIIIICAAALQPRARVRTTGIIIWRAREILAGAGYDGPVPSDRTFYRLFGTLSHGRHMTGSASTRRSLAGRPKGTFGSLAVAAPRSAT